MKKENPYARLKRIATGWIDAALHRTHTPAFTFPAKDLDKTAYLMFGVAQAVSTASKLGYETVLRTSAAGDLEVSYRRTLPDRPWML